jgi:hypothetical protein
MEVLNLLAVSSLLAELGWFEIPLARASIYAVGAGAVLLLLNYRPFLFRERWRVVVEHFRGCSHSQRGAARIAAAIYLVGSLLIFLSI